MNLTKGSWQVPLNSDARQKSAFTTPLGLFEFLVLPFGLNGALTTFQSLADQFLRGTEDFALVYLDEEPVSQVKRVLGHLHDRLQRLESVRWGWQRCCTWPSRWEAAA